MLHNSRVQWMVHMANINFYYIYNNIRLYRYQSIYHCKPFWHMLQNLVNCEYEFYLILNQMCCLLLLQYYVEYIFWHSCGLSGFYEAYYYFGYYDQYIEDNNVDDCDGNMPLLTFSYKYKSKA